MLNRTREIFNQSFLNPTTRVCTGGLSYADVVTKFSVIDRFPFFFYVWGSTARGSSTNNIIINMTVSNDTVPIDGPKSDE